MCFPYLTTCFVVSLQAAKILPMLTDFMSCWKIRPVIRCYLDGGKITFAKGVEYKDSLKR